MSLPKIPSSLNRENPSTLNSHPSTFIFPPSVQSDLFNYLKPAQQETLKPILRIMKRPYQAKLCTALLDYLEGNGIQSIDDPMLDKLQHNIIDICEIHPLRVSKFQGSKVPKPIGDIIKQVFPSFGKA